MPEALTDEELRFLQETFDLAREGATAELTARVDAGVPVDLTNSVGDTLLLLAAYHVHEDTVRALLERGADHARVNDKGQTALGAAVFRQARGVVELLLAAGADPALGRQSGLAVAQVFDLPEMAELLRGAGRAPDVP
ncbi:ankyrin repeat domain-containing protein [Kineococcus sp. SYSU DK004]|uniref:ankyrin repeat domain-containing protein n=1 Tax=Kineococcus sp. SYSU DK004 TaxID=3383125 RepID=UPI003D7ED24D